VIIDNDLAVITLQTICKDPTAPAAARAQAARTLLEISGILKNPVLDLRKTPINELSSSEIDKRISELDS
jgi:hypothetical protein